MSENKKPHWKQKLTDEQVREIRELAASGTPQNEIVKAYKIASGHVSPIVRGLARAAAGGPILQKDGTFKEFSARGKDVVFPRKEAAAKMSEKVLPPVERAAAFREKVRATPERYVPRIVKGADTRRDMSQYLRLLVTVPKATDLQGLTLAEVVTYLNTLMISEKPKFEGTIAAEFFARIKPFPKAHQRLLGPIVALAFNLVQDGPVRHRVFRSVEQITQEQALRSLRKTSGPSTPQTPAEAGIKDLGAEVLEKVKAQLNTLMGRLDFIDPTPQLEVLQKQLSALDASVDGQAGRVAAKLQQIELLLQNRLGGLDTQITHLGRTVATIGAETKGMAKEMERCTNFMDATRNRILEEKRQGLQQTVNPTPTEG